MASKKKKKQAPKASKNATSALLKPTLAAAEQSQHASNEATNTAPPEDNEALRTGLDLTLASAAVFDTVELLEEIVGHLPPRQFYAIQRVCCRFRDILQAFKSPVFRKNYFTELSARREIWVSRHDLIYHQTGPGGSLRETDRHEIFLKGDKQLRNSDKQLTPVRLCPLSPIAQGPATVAAANKRLQNMTQLEMRAVVDRPDSAAKMLLTDPPCFSIWLSMDFTFSEIPDRTYSAEGEFNRYSPKAWTVGDIARAVMDEERDMVWRQGGSDGYMGRMAVKTVMQCVARQLDLKAVHSKSFIVSVDPGFPRFVPSHELRDAMEKDGRWVAVRERGVAHADRARPNSTSKPARSMRFGTVVVRRGGGHAA